jgi:2-C-methyl-D-erythritol 2,4-cyclodiphosphate synthase
MNMRIGQGYDVHQLAEGCKLIIGGVEIPHEKGLLGHSDADVLLHAICDALLGAAALGDIGRHFSDTDATIIAQAPKMAPHIFQMVENIAADLRVEKSAVNVKATTTEKLGFAGRGEGIAAQAVVLLLAE